MPRAPDERIEKAYELFKKGTKLVDIASQLDLPQGTVRRWKSTRKWNSERSDKNNERSGRKKGGQPANKNAIGNDGGAPIRNKNAETHGFFSRYLPEETFSIIQQIEHKDPLDILWENIQIAYAAIVRAQQIMYVRDSKDSTTTKIAESNGEKSYGEKWEVQQAWDKQATFLSAQARAQSELRSLIKRYDEMLHKNWDLVTEEQVARIAALKAKSQPDNDEEIVDDGFMDALNSSVAEDWADEED